MRGHVRVVRSWIGKPRVLALRRASFPILVLLLSAPGTGAELGKDARRQIVEEWTKKTGFARRDLNNVQILPNFRMSIRTDPEDLIPAGTKVSVTEVDIEEDHRTIGLHVSQVGRRRWTEVHLILDTPFGATLTDEQKAQLNAMWARLVSPETIDSARSNNAPEETGAASNGAVLTVYRAHIAGFGGSVPFAFNCDGLDVAGLADSRYVTVDLEPGPHHCYFAREEYKTDITLEAGQEYYLEIKPQRMGGAKLRLVDRQEALKAIQKFKYEDAKNIWDRANVRPGGR
jgi:hypothetical protein